MKALLQPVKSHPGMPTSPSPTHDLLRRSRSGTSSPLTDDAIVRRGQDSILVAGFGLVEEIAAQGKVVNAAWLLRLVCGEQEGRDVFLHTWRHG